jgi:hypothetical protein
MTADVADCRGSTYEVHLFVVCWLSGGASGVVHVDGVRGALLTRSLGNDDHGRSRRPMIYVA